MTDQPIGAKMNENERNLLDEKNDPLGSARGLMNGVFIVLPFWLIILKVLKYIIDTYGY